MREYFFLLAGGYGKRTEPLSFYKPKPAFPLDGTPLIQIMLDQLIQVGLKQGFINLHHLPNLLRPIIESRPLENIVYLPEETLSGSRILNSAGDQMAAADLLLVVNGDIFLELPYPKMRDRLLKEKADGVLLVRPMPRVNNAAYRPLKLEKNRFVQRTDNGDFMYTGTALFTRKVLQQIQGINFFDTLESGGFHILVLPYTGIWLDIGDIPSYREANFAYTQYQEGKRVGREKEKEEEKETNSLSPGVTISADSQVSHCIIWENTVIQNHSVLHNCIVTGNLCLDAVVHQNKIITQ